MEITKELLKLLAKNLLKDIKEIKEIKEFKYSHFLESFAHSLGFYDYNALSTKLTNINNSKNNDNINWKDFLEIVKKEDFNYRKNQLKIVNEDDNNRILKPIDMSLYDFCNHHFKRTQEERVYYPDAEEYFNLKFFEGHKIISINAKTPSFFIINNDDKIKKNRTFEVVFYVDNSNVVLRYTKPSHFVLDLLDFQEVSDYHFSMHPEEFKNMFLHIFSIHTHDSFYEDYLRIS